MGRGGGSGIKSEHLAAARGSARQEIAALLPDGAEAWEVGGSIRDRLLGREAKDLDVTVTGIGAEELYRAAAGAGDITELRVADRLIGIRLRAPWTDPEGIEIALARTESSSGPGHTDFLIDCHPDLGIEEDLGRRDFTCNALAARINRDGSLDGIVDPLGGQRDISERRLRQTHPGAIAEDPLRALRGLVRVARDGFSPDEETAAALRASGPSLGPDGPLSPERVFTELDKLINSPDAAAALALARDLGIYGQVLPELAPTIGFDQESKYHSLSVDQHCLGALELACRNGVSPEVRWAALLHDSGKPASAWRGDDGRLHYYATPEHRSHQEVGAEITAEILERLRAPKALGEEVTYLVAEHMWMDDREFRRVSDQRQEIKARRFLHRHGRDRAQKLLELRLCDNDSKGARAEERLLDSRAFLEEVNRQSQAVVELSGLEISGDDLRERGLRGPEIGAALNDFLDRIVIDPELNDRQRLLQWADRLVEQ